MLKTAISFGLVHIPVGLNPIIKNNNTTFNMIHKKCGERIKYQKICPICEKEVKNTDLVKGYEFKKNEYITLDQTEFDKLKTENDKIIDIISFVNLSEIDPIYFEKSYFLKADNNKAFSLFKTALNKTNKVAIAKTVLGSKSYYVILRFGKENIIMNTLFYEEEIFLDDQTNKENFTKKELELAIELINNMTSTFKPEEYKDEYQNKLSAAIEKKIDGKDIKQVKSKRKESVSNLMEALEKSLKKK